MVIAEKIFEIEEATAAGSVPLPLTPRMVGQDDA